MSQVLDAYGRSVEELGICARCGASIKYIYFHNGQTYGSDCIEIVTGIRKEHQVYNNRVLDLKASQERQAQTEKKANDRHQANLDLEAKRSANRQANAIKFEQLINVLNNASRNSYDFCAEMAKAIATNGFSTDITDALSSRQLQIVREIWGKTYGRSGSKAYNLGVAEFDAKFDPEA